MRIWIILAGLMGAQAVISGAISAHADVSDYQRGLLDKAVQYEIWHALALIAIYLLTQKEKSRLLLASASFFTAGGIFFCGSLYTLGFTGTSLFPMSAPIGGSCLILGWLSLALFGLMRARQPQHSA